IASGACCWPPPQVTRSVRIRIHHPASGHGVIDMIGGGIGRSHREWTDDTSMALAIAEAAATGVDISTDAGLDAIAAQFVRWYDSDPADIGNQTRAVLPTRPADAAAMRERAWAVPGRKGGNGSLMRTAPVALAFLDDEGRCVRAARAIGLLTHHDERAVEACEMCDVRHPHAVLHGTFDACAATSRSPTAAPARTGRRCSTPPRPARPRTSRTTVGSSTHCSRRVGDAGTPRGPEQLPAALERAVRAGHDTDTTAAIAGGLLGARWGRVGGAGPLRACCTAGRAKRGRPGPDRPRHRVTNGRDQHR
ncbi:hypothetical protein GS426_07530, partial [Rhodococcus hoagii]|nr:hypothetical protein [Prescottella equi]